jgi:maleate cis-trans isomerase
MTDVLGWRRKFGVIGPSTNTVVQPDFDGTRPPGVTNHCSQQSHPMEARTIRQPKRKTGWSAPNILRRLPP